MAIVCLLFSFVFCDKSHSRCRKKKTFEKKGKQSKHWTDFDSKRQFWTDVWLYSIYIYIYVCPVGSITGPPFSSKNSSQHVDQLLTLPWTSYWPYPLRPIITKTVPEIGWNPYFYCVFEETHIQTTKNPKNKNTIILTFGNIIAPFDLDRKLSRFLAPPFLILFVTSLLLTWQHNNIKNTTATNKQPNKQTSKQTNKQTNNKNNNYSNNKNNNYNKTPTTKTQQQLKQQQLKRQQTIGTTTLKETVITTTKMSTTKITTTTTTKQIYHKKTTMKTIACKTNTTIITTYDCCNINML